MSGLLPFDDRRPQLPGPNPGPQWLDMESGRVFVSRMGSIQPTVLYLTAEELAKVRVEDGTAILKCSPLRAALPNLFAKSVTLEQVIPHLDPAFGDQLVLWLRAIELSYVDAVRANYFQEHRIARSFANQAAMLLAKRREQEQPQ